MAAIAVEPASVARRTAAAFAALGKVADKELLREQLPGGAAHDVKLKIVAIVDGDETLSVEFDAMVNVGHDHVSASSSACDQEHLLAIVLSKLNANTRDKLLVELPGEFAKLKNELPLCPAAFIEQASKLLEKLRAQKSAPKKGSVSVRYLPAGKS